MKADQAQTKKTSSLPVPSVTKVEPVSPYELVSNVCEAFNTPLSSSPTFKRFLLEIHEDDRDVLPLAVTFLTTGSETSRLLTRDAIWKTIKDMQSFTHWDEDEGIDKRSGSRKWTDEHQLTKARLASAWSVGNVIEESGAQVDPKLELESVLEFAYFLAGHTRHDKLSSDPSYWRGVAALSLTSVVGANKSNRITEFIEWAGKHEDISAVMTTMIERKTVIVPVLQGNMEQTDIAPSLSSGRL
jgi:hypothetical protein